MTRNKVIKSGTRLDQSIRKVGRFSTETVFTRTITTLKTNPFYKGKLANHIRSWPVVGLIFDLERPENSTFGRANVARNLIQPNDLVLLTGRTLSREITYNFKIVLYDRSVDDAARSPEKRKEEYIELLHNEEVCFLARRDLKILKRIP